MAELVRAHATAIEKAWHEHLRLEAERYRVSRTRDEPEILESCSSKNSN